MGSRIVGGRTANADRVASYQQIAEHANLRSQIRAEQIAVSMELEMMPRAAAVGGIALMIREEVVEDESWVRTNAKRLLVNLTAVHK